MKKILFIFLIIFAAKSFAQQYRTEYGDDIFPGGTIHALNIFINIIFDECPECEPYKYDTLYWKPGNPNLLNSNPPVYLENFMDRGFDPENIRGSLTKFYADASFNQFIMVGDFVTVNIPQSFISPGISNNFIDRKDLANAAISYINNLGGLQTQYGNNNIAYYDGWMRFSTPIVRFQTKTAPVSNNKIDFVQFFIRNATDYYGNVNEGGTVGLDLTENLLVNGTYYDFEEGMNIYLGTKASNISIVRRIPTEVHEIAHHLLGRTNSMHMGGGSPLNRGSLTILSGNTGWSLLSGFGTLTTCSAFDRWRLNWRGPLNNAYRIAASNSNSDIKKTDGNKTFYLRDFMSFGDAIRIKLPYVDEGAFNQYIWLEYHRIHQNGKIDHPTFFDSDCKDYGIPGIFAYYQVGKDIPESSNFDNMIPSYTDHLIPFCADGRWDVRKLAQTGDPCMYGSEIVNYQEYYRENPLCGYSDLNSNHFFNEDPGNTLNYETSGITQKIIKVQGGFTTDKVQNLGDNGDPFAGTSTVNISTNPTPVNVVTYYHEKEDDGTITKTAITDNRKIHLSGLKIDMFPQANQTYRVDVKWNHYYVSDNVTWTGDIVLHERVDLDEDFKITFDQNETPDKHIRDFRTNKFSGPTYFTALDNSEFEMHDGSDVELKNLSSFIVEQGGKLEIKNNSTFVVNSGTTVVLKSGSDLYISGTGILEIEPGGCLCIEDGANITLLESLSRIHLKADARQITNNLTLPSYLYYCQHNLLTETFSGTGDIIIDNNPLDTYIQNEIISGTTTITGRDIYAGEKVTQNESFGLVKINSGANITFDATGDIVLDRGFEAELGSQITLQ